MFVDFATSDRHQAVAVLGIFGIVLALVRIARAVTSIAEINSLAQLHNKPARELLPSGWGLVEVGDVIEVAHGQLEGLHMVSAIHDEGRIEVSPV
jgi:hypothetical protein